MDYDLFTNTFKISSLNVKDESKTLICLTVCIQYVAAA